MSDSTWIEIKTRNGWAAYRLTDIREFDSIRGKLYQTIVSPSGELLSIPTEDIDNRPNRLVRPTYPRQSYQN